MNIAYLSGNMGGLELSSSSRNKKAYNGKQETFTLLSLLANNNPQNKYLVYHRCGGYKKYIESGQYEKDFPHKNVYFVANECVPTPIEKMNKDGSIHKDLSEAFDRIIKMTNELGGIDFGISFCTFKDQGIPGTIRKRRDPNSYAKLLVSGMICCYSLFVSEYYKFDYISFSVDMRFIENKSLSYTNPPKCIFGFLNREMDLELIKSFDKESYINKDFVTHKVDMIYDGADLLSLASPESIIDNSDININNKSGFTIYANQHSSSSFDRLKSIREFTNGIDIKIYGKFDKDSKYYDNDIYNMLDRESMFNDMKDLKYTFILINDENGTPTSSKFWECTHMKVIPFMDDRYGSYDWRNYHKIPSFLFIKNNEELKEKIRFLEENPVFYKTLVNYNSSLIKYDYYNGKYLSDKINNCINKYINKKYS